MHTICVDWLQARLIPQLLLVPQIIMARNFLPIDCDQAPDTYVKCYVKDGERLKHKKKTRVVRHSLEPSYKQCLKYQVRGLEPRTGSSHN